MIFVQRLQPANLVVLYGLSFFTRVGVWQYIGVPGFLLKRFEILTSPEEVGLERWQMLEEKAHAAWKVGVDRIAEQTQLKLSVGGLAISWLTPWCQWLALQTKECFFFQEIVSHYPVESKSVMFSPVRKWLVQQGVQFDRLEAKELHWGQSLHRLFWWMQFEVHVLRQIRNALKAKKRAPTPKKLKFVTAGYMARDMADGPGQQDLTLFVDKGIYPVEETLFVFSVLPNQKTTEYFASKNILWTTDWDLPAIVSRWGRIRFLFGIGFFYFKLQFVWRERFQLPIVAAMAVRSLIWNELLREHPSLKTAIYTVSCFYPERPETTFLNQKGVRTINWSYSASDFKFFSKPFPYQDKILEFCLNSSKEIWFWGEFLIELQRNRRHPRFSTINRDRVVGAVMCGESSLLQLSPEQARQTMKIDRPGKKVIGIFDFPLTSKDWLRRFALGASWHQLETIEKFYSDLEEYQNQNPDIVYLIKAKSYRDPDRPSASTMLRLADPDGEAVRSGRVLFFDSKADPYVPIACSDLCISPPITSPIIAALSHKRSAFFYDSDFTTTFMSPSYLEQLLVHGKENLFLELDRWKENPETYYRAQMDLPQMSRIVGPVGDPLITFKKLLDSD